jgi:transcriptional regulator with XRE-family HTH domain
MRFRNRVRVVRHARGLSVAALARLSGVSHQTIFSLERDDGYAPRGQVQLRLCMALNDTGLFWIEREAGDVPPDAEG